MFLVVYGARCCCCCFNSFFSHFISFESVRMYMYMLCALFLFVPFFLDSFRFVSLVYRSMVVAYTFVLHPNSLTTRILLFSKSVLIVSLAPCLIKHQYTQTLTLFQEKWRREKEREREKETKRTQNSLGYVFAIQHFYLLKINKNYNRELSWEHRKDKRTWIECVCMRACVRTCVRVRVFVNHIECPAC